MKNELKANYIKRLREQSAYPALRLSLDVALGITLVATPVWFILFAISLNIDPTHITSFLYLGCAFLFPFFGLLARESGSLLIDIADSITDLNSRYEGQ